MTNRIKLLNQKFGKLLVLSFVETDKRRHSRFLCRCDCGVEKIILGTSLQTGKTTSCGCYHKERVRLSFGEANFNSKFSAYKTDAKSRNLDFFLTKERFRKLTQQNCFYCGRKPSSICINSGTHGAFVYNGIDRVDNNIGYTEDNCVSCCKIYNRAKSDIHYDEFLEYLHGISRKYKD